MLMGVAEKIIKNHLKSGKLEQGKEVTIGDFFGLGHGMLYPYVSMPFVIGSQNGLNCYWPMPYLKSARTEITNEGEKDINLFYYIIDFREYKKPPKDVGLFHAKYQQEMSTAFGKNSKGFEAAGRGHFVGLNMSIELYQDKWWGVGDGMIWIDGEEIFSVAGTAGEDYFGGAWCYSGGTFHAHFIGNPLQHPNAPHKKGVQWNVYRYLIPDPVPLLTIL